MGRGVDTTIIDSWSALEDFLFQDEWSELNRHRTKRVFRGLTDSTFSLATTLQRVGGSSRQLESRLLRQFKKYAHRNFAVDDSDWHWLAVAQHHGLPTRFLDWTNSPFVALHFATADWPNSGTDGAVWALDFIGLQQWLPDPLRQRLQHDGVNVFTTKELASVAFSLQELEKLSSEDFMVIFEPPSIDDRIVNQYAALSAMSRPDTVAESWLRNRERAVCHKLVIPARLKATIRERLDMMNITERVLFPGLDGLANWLRRYYGPTWPDSSVRQPLYRGKHLHFFRSPNGWEYVQRPNIQAGVAVVAVTSEDRLLLIEQHREALNKSVIELPAGIIEPGASPEATAKQEFFQETGYSCDRLTLLCEGALSPGVANETNIIYLAGGLNRKDTEIDDVIDGGIIRHRKLRGRAEEHELIQTWEIPIREVPAWLQQRRQEGVIIDLRIYAGLSFSQNYKTASRVTPT
jgi:8-oxo-dGTP pyrophosphatase MutT (NUDIX family)